MPLFAVYSDSPTLWLISPSLIPHLDKVLHNTFDLNTSTHRRFVSLRMCGSLRFCHSLCCGTSSLTLSFSACLLSHRSLTILWFVCGAHA